MHLNFWELYEGDSGCLPAPKQFLVLSYFQSSVMNYNDGEVITSECFKVNIHRLMLIYSHHIYTAHVQNIHKQFTDSHANTMTILPYNGKFAQKKTFTIFTFCWPFTNDF